MSAIHHDTSSDLKVVGTKLKDILEVKFPVFIDVQVFYIFKDRYVQMVSLSFSTFTQF